jgi:endonuclease/exonuclease/phosphatase family metal-dependent hydrolase
MLRSRPRAVLAALVVLAAACQPEEKTARLTVMSRNLYLGAELNPLLEALVGFEMGLIPPALYPAVIPPLVDEAWAEVQGTDFPARAKVIAAEIAAQQPDVVGLQEVALWRTGAGAPATTVIYDFLELLRTEVTALGLSYQAASSVQNFDGELPLSDGTLVRYTDRDVILARSGVFTTGATGGNYAAKFPVTTATGPLGVELSVPRGWTSVEVQKDGVRFRVYATHLEVENPPLNYFQAGQATELAQILAAEPLPTIVLGDFNSDGSQTHPISSTPTYPLMRDLGFGDPWADLYPLDPGFTFCGATDTTLTALSTCDARLDHNFYRGGFTPLATTQVPVATTLSGIYASDHKAVASRFEITVPGAR